MQYFNEILIRQNTFKNIDQMDIKPSNTFDEAGGRGKKRSNYYTCIYMFVNILYNI